MKKLFIFIVFSISGIMGHAAMTDIYGEATYPPKNEDYSISAGPSYTAATIDATNEKVGGVVQWNSTQSIKAIWVVLGAISPGNPIFLDWRMETIGPGTPSPSGNLVCANSSGTFQYDGGQDNLTLRTGNVVEDCIPSIGTPVAIYFNSTYTVPSTAVNISMADFGASDFEYRITSNTTAGWSFASSNINLAIELKDGSFMQKAVPFYENMFATNTTSTMRYVGMKGTPKFGLRAVGALFWADPDSPVKFDLWNDNNLVASTVEISTYARPSANIAGLQRVFFTTPTIIPANTDFYLAASTTGVFGTATFYINQSTSVAVFQGTTSGAANVVEVRGGATITSESSWSVDTRQKPFMWLIYDQIDVGSGGQRSSSYIGP